MDRAAAYDIGDLAHSIRVGLWWIEDLLAEGASDEQIEEVVEMIRPLFIEYQMRTRLH